MKIKSRPEQSARNRRMEAALPIVSRPDCDTIQSSARSRLRTSLQQSESNPGIALDWLYGHPVQLIIVTITVYSMHLSQPDLPPWGAQRRGGASNTAHAGGHNGASLLLALPFFCGQALNFRSRLALHHLLHFTFHGCMRCSFLLTLFQARRVRLLVNRQQMRWDKRSCFEHNHGQGYCMT